MASTPAKEVRELRTAMFFQQRGLCFYCEQPMLLAKGGRSGAVPGTMATLEHIVPQACGGTSDRDNLAAACRNCNCERGDSDARMFMLTKMGLA